MIGLGIGVGWATKRRLVNYINELIKQFKDRVAADGGTFEAEQCLKNTLNTLGITVPPTVISAPVISGSTAIGSVISTTNGVFDGVTPITYTYQWLLDGSPILGATSSTYTTENLRNLTCKVTATNDFGSANSTSNSLELTPLLLDTYTNSAAAYSLRKLRTNYTGSAIRVRRASDNTEMNIGFVNNELDIVTLETFCSGTNGFVTTWYDQSGNNRNAIQTTLLNQPQIVIFGSIFLENGKPAIKPVAGQNLVANILAGSQYSIFQLDKRGSITANYYIPNRGGNNGNYYWYNVYNSNLTGLGSNQGTPNYYINSNLFSGTTQGQAWNFDTGNQRILTALNLNLSTWTKYEFQYGVGDNNFVSFQERILFNSNQSLNRTGIETNINEFYSIY